MELKRCHECQRNTPHSDGICLICFPTVRRLELLREIHPEVGDDEDEKISPVRLPNDHHTSS